ncbi:hypothetical protein [Streptomyces sp. NPDC005209]|uniref:hypothetical protein n=1 Tax=Streptomyces sp. NPDC005209 TaxID=3156715 RepID=UPI0033B77E02
MSATRSLARGRGLPRDRAWLRALVLLLVLLVPGTRAELHAAPVAVAGDLTDHDVLDTAPRPPSRAAHQPVVPTRPESAPAPAPAVPAGCPAAAPPRPPHMLPALRSVVLRC